MNKKDCPNIAMNMKHCNCTFTCSRKGMCCECVHYHRMRRELPACYFTADIEKTGDRSINRYKL